ncbi:MAG TPA: FAD-dependent oxidoreductase [Bacillota bacterium]
MGSRGAPAEHDVVIAGAGWAGAAAALSAAGAGARTLLIERTDAILGLGLVGGIFRNNGRFTAAEEALALGGGGILFQVMDECARHAPIEFPGHHHASLYDVTRIEGAVRQILRDRGVTVRMETRLTDVERDGGRLTSLIDAAGNRFKAAAFVDATGTFGPMNNCVKHGNGCAMCVMRCPSYGGRVSLVTKAGVREFVGERPEGKYGAMSGACEIALESLDDAIRRPLERDGVYIVKLPKASTNHAKLKLKACIQYAHSDFAENLILLDTGHAKLMTPYFPLDLLRSMAGFERARFIDPGAAGRANSMRFFAVSPQQDTLLVDGLDNLFCAGEKAGLIVGHTEAVVTGMLAGHNAANLNFGRPLLRLPEDTLIGDFIAHTGRAVRRPEGVARRYTFSGSTYFARMREMGLYSTDREAVRQRLNRLGLLGIMGNGARKAWTGTGGGDA